MKPLKILEIIPLICFLLTFTSLASHDKIKDSDTEIEKFVQTEVYYKNREITKDYRVRTLKKNLYSAFRHSLQKRYPNYKTIMKDIKEEDIRFQFIPNSLNYFVRVKNYAAYYLFTLDPELYIQLPEDEKFFENVIIDKSEKKENPSIAPIKE